MIFVYMDQYSFISMFIYIMLFTAVFQHYRKRFNLYLCFSRFFFCITDKLPSLLLLLRSASQATPPATYLRQWQPVATAIQNMALSQ